MDDKLGKVLIVDDDIHINELIDMYLQSGGYSTKKCFNGNDACNIVMTEDIGLVILDVMLPGKDGIDVLKHIRKNSDIPVIMLTAKGEVFDKVLALELGADDYMVKPFDPKELLARVKAVTRRYAVDNQSKDDSVDKIADFIQERDNTVLICNTENLGFARGNNVGIEYANKNYKPQYLVVLNSDTELMQDNLVEKLDKEYEKTGFALLGPLILTADG